MSPSTEATEAGERGGRKWRERTEGQDPGEGDGLRVNHSAAKGVRRTQAIRERAMRRTLRGRAVMVTVVLMAVSSTVTLAGAQQAERGRGKLLVATPPTDLAQLQGCLKTFAPSLIDPEGLILGSILAAPGQLCAETFRHPLQALGQVRGPLPLFETLNDPSGMRYVVGEGSSIAREGATTGRTTSGLYLASRRAMTDAERAADAVPPLGLAEPPRVNPDLARAVAESPGGDIEVVLALRDTSPGIGPALERLIAQGGIRTRGEYEAAGDTLRRQQNALVARAVDAAAAAVEGVGGKVGYRCRNLPCVVALVPASTVGRLAALPDVVEIDVVRPAIDAGMSGTEVRTGTQLRQFATPPLHFDGNGLNELNEADNVVGAVIEAGGGYSDHNGFREYPGYFHRYASSANASGKWACITFGALEGCGTVASPDSPGDLPAYPSVSGHAMGAAGLFFGDLMDGQDPTVVGTAQEAMSGYAPEARAHLYWFNSGDAAVVAFDHIAGLTASQHVPDLITNSWGFTENPRCSGTSSVARAANRLYRDGIAVFAAAHNLGGSATDCRVTAPGSALGTFTVGAHMWLNGDGIAAATPNTVRTAPIYDNGDSLQSSWGGNGAQGQNRSIVDLTGPGTRTNRFGGICCTSMATPTVAGHAASFIDFYRATYSNFIDNPGSLYASMLLMGDRQGTAGKVISSPDHRWGAGRTRMRMFNSAGMDAPWHYFNGWTCVANGEVVDFPVAEGALLNRDVDVLKAAAYWYDTRHDGSDQSGNTGTVANVNMRLVDAVGGNTIVTDPDGFDNKARLYAEGVGGKRVTLRITGQTVTGHTDPVCGTDAIRVYFTHFAEDSDRNSPTFDPATGAGIFPEGS